MKISVLTPSIRPEGLKYVQESLEKQTLTDFEWLVELGVPGKGHDLNAAYNRMLKRAKGELIVSLQDYTRILPDGLQKFWDAYLAHPDTFMTAPHGKTMDWIKIDWDWRAYNDKAKEDGMVDSRWDCWEIDWGAAPLSCLKNIGGFDEELDVAWSCDNVNVGKRAQLAGYKFGNLFTNPAMGLKHDELMNHPFRHKFNPHLNAERMRQFEVDGLKINYLSPTETKN